jgi:hypothetical protein
VKKFRGSSGDIDITDDEFLDRSPDRVGDAVDSDDVGEETDEKKKTGK